MKRWALCLLAGMSLSGCYAVRYQTRLPAGGSTHRQWLNYYLFGLVGQHDIDLDQVCPQGVHAWRTEAAAIGLLDLVTLGIYSPRTVTIECAPGGEK